MAPEQQQPSAHGQVVRASIEALAANARRALVPINRITNQIKESRR